ncbi:MAG: DUF4390 domain-containing protein [Chromatiales bacterium]|jgi:hypothetical protein|nr:DUF4390 domain-containing protein [Chromatiales bacterium]
MQGARIGLIMLCLSAVWAGGARTQEQESAGIQVTDVHVVLHDEVYYLDASVEYVLSRQLSEALERGVALPVVIEIEILRERPYIWNETVATLAQRYELNYHALTRQYMLRNLNIGTQSSYPSRVAALGALGRVVSLPLIDANLLEPDVAYQGRLRVRIDTDALPAPLRLRALAMPEWRLGSGWHEWRF